jgi:hypothetical protein
MLLCWIIENTLENKSLHKTELKKCQFKNMQFCMIEKHCGKNYFISTRKLFFDGLVLSFLFYFSRYFN